MTPSLMACVRLDLGAPESCDEVESDELSVLKGPDELVNPGRSRRESVLRIDLSARSVAALEASSRRLAA